MASTELRVAAQQALEALQDFKRRGHWGDFDNLTGTLQAALVEDAMQKFTDVNQELEAALAEPVQEPVAGRAFFERILAAMEGVIDVADRKTDEFDALRSCVIDLTLMLHTAPPQRPAEPVQEPGDFDHGIGADRFKVVRGAFWWHVLIGDSPTEHGKFRSRAGAEKMAADLLREFRNGAFVQHEAALAEPDLSHCPKCGGPADNGHDRSIPPSPYWCTKCMAEPAQERNFCPRCGKRTNGIHTCTPPAPLTDEVIAELWHQNGGFHHHFARAIERWLRGHA